MLSASAGEIARRLTLRSSPSYIKEPATLEPSLPVQYQRVKLSGVVKLSVTCFPQIRQVFVTVAIFVFSSAQTTFVSSKR